MKATIKTNPRNVTHGSLFTLGTGLGWGLIGGLTGTLVMHLVLMATLSGVGLPVFTGFSIIGNTAARFFSILGIHMSGGVSMGVAVYYLLGLIIGAIYGAAVTQVHALRVDTLKKSLILAVLYEEILSQPILAMTPILLKITATETLQWFGISFVMHLIFGVILGVVVSYGLQLAGAVNHPSLRTKPALNFSTVLKRI